MRQNLGRQEGRGSTKRLRTLVANTLLGQAKVCQLCVPLLIQNDILGLEISEDDPPLVQMAERQQYFGCVHVGDRVLQVLLAADELLQISSRAELEHHHQAARGLESVMQRDDVWMVDVGKDVALRQGVPLQVSLLDLALLQDLHGVEVCGGPVLDFVDLSERAFAQHHNHLEGIGADPLHRLVAALDLREGPTHALLARLARGPRGACTNGARCAC
mmetsp:Transcript_58317/g.190191  ORF Transcript_58317/g.190191 Transcript_58317/m.190191 type:complete len:217 (+) Transcript_58317:706-1356(+)